MRRSKSEFEDMFQQQEFIQSEGGVTRWSLVEPLWVDFDVDVTPLRNSSVSGGKSPETKDKYAISNLELRAKIEQLLRSKKLTLEQVASEVGLSAITARRVCRTLGLVRYDCSARRRGVLSRSSQTPFGWLSEQCVLREVPVEMKWVHAAKEMRKRGQGYHAIAHYFQGQGILTKNGG